jgi:hypothetical protein
MSREDNLGVELEEKRWIRRPGIKQIGSIKINLKKMGYNGQVGPGDYILDQLCDYQLLRENFIPWSWCVTLHMHYFFVPEQITGPHKF